MGLFLRTVGAVALLGVIGLAGLAWWVSGHQFSAKAAPSRLEAIAAQQLRRLAMGRDARDRRNPEPGTEATLMEGREHFADHCAVCHGNDGSGETEMGAGLYPKTPDLRTDHTQQLTDGELFFIIENGVRFTGMPGWSNGTAAGEQASWRLVDFIRHLPQQSADERLEMERLNPRSFEEWQQERDASEFLGNGSEPPALPPHHHPAETDTKEK